MLCRAAIKGSVQIVVTLLGNLQELRCTDRVFDVSGQPLRLPDLFTWFPCRSVFSSQKVGVAAMTARGIQ